ncbi:MAG: SH3 domain-containing protein [Treponema sp.]|nr:SH3 domain-containing protein [Treponema sp.]MCL2181475.1 SH3 domain-containing protein [Treponema sp.]
MMKKALFILSFLILVLGSSCFGKMDEPKKSSDSAMQVNLVQNAVVKANGTNMREGPSTRHAVITVLSGGTVLNIMERPANSEWFKVDYNGSIGYVHQSLITY